MHTGQLAYVNNTVSLLATPPLPLGHSFAVAGVPFGGAVTNRPGARFGP
ncbi:hypothetical protein [Polaromonas sp. CG9_12]|nr:hypothetical protein [Polaromonas sp. CG_9.11]MBG6076552.1 agmatinase [Polaromonas sp. CG_9.11]CDS49940.1 hypothetical protein [Polaromonas sp. CG9_12]